MATAANNKQVNMVGGHNVVEDFQTIPFSGLKQPFNPPPPVTGEFKQELFFMASMSDMPDMTGKIMPFCSCHLYESMLSGFYYSFEFDNLACLPIPENRPYGNN